MDLVDASGGVCIAYAAELRTLGLRRRFGGIELYGPSGVREVHRAIDVSSTSEGDGCEIRGDFADGQFSMRHLAVEPGWKPAGAPACKGLSWHVLGARARAVVELARGGATRRFAGTGYSDWVELTKPTRFLGLSRLEWGRFHLPDRTFVFSCVRKADGETWQRTLSITGENRLESAQVTLEDTSGSLVCRGSGAELVLSSPRVLHDGPVFDAERLPGTLERRLSELITGPAEERRIVGRTRDSPSKSESSLGWGIAESVRFDSSNPLPRERQASGTCPDVARGAPR